jgi:hypothetical protein
VKVNEESKNTCIYSHKQYAQHLKDYSHNWETLSHTNPLGSSSSEWKRATYEIVSMTEPSAALLQPDFRALFESAPGAYLVLTSVLVTAAMSDGYL